jgi:hypothetical protein
MDNSLLYASGQSSTVTNWYEGQLSQKILDPAVFAFQTKPLLNVQYTAQSIGSTMGGFSSFPINNTVLKMLDGQDPLAVLITDCIPCLQRVLDLANINPLGEFMTMLENELDKRWGYIQSMWNGLNAQDQNLCDLLNYLNSMCIPDLFALLAILSYYWLQLTKLFDINIYKLIWSIIAPFFQSILMSLDSLIQRFLKLIVAPVECIITSLDHEYSKLYNLGNMSWDSKKGLTVNKPYDNTVEKWATDNITNPILQGKGPLGTGLLELKKGLTNARDYLNSQLKRLHDAIAEKLGADGSALDTSQGLFTYLRWLALVVGLVKAVIQFKQNGYQCGPDGITSPQYYLIAQYIADNTGTPIQVTDSTVVSPGSEPVSDTSEIPVTPSDTVTPGITPSVIDPVALAQQLLAAAPAAAAIGTESTIAQGGYNLPDCVQVRDELERAKVAAWQTELDNLP